MHFLRLFSVVLAILFFSARGFAQGLGWDGPEQPRDHITHTLHIEMHMSFDEPNKKLFGKVIHTLEILPQSGPVDSVVFDDTMLNIQRVWLDEHGKQTTLKVDTTGGRKLIMHLGKVMPFHTSFIIGIDYSVTPKKGMYFMAPDTFYTERPEQIWTQGEGEDNHFWLPTYDYPNDKTTTDMFVTVRSDQQALSNGHLVSKDKNKDGTVTWHWKEDHPYSTYLIMLGKDVDYWMYPGWAKEAHRIFGLTPKMLEFYSSRTGFPYAWEKYAQIPIADFMYGGMENVTATTLNDYVMFDKRSGVDFSSEGLIAHELAHQWFGDLVTCRSWVNTWLNESFATYFEAMFRQFNDGQDEFDEENQGSMNAGLSAEAMLGKKPIVAANNYTANIYPRGAATLNMLHHILGDSGWWSSINHYLNVHQFQPVEANDLEVAVEEATGQNVEWFFDEWLYKSGHPIFDVTYNYDDAAKNLHMTVTQSQDRDTLTGTFRTPVDVELTMPNGSTIKQTLHVEDSSQQFDIPAPEKPAMVIFDKGNSIIKELHIHKSTEEWIYQLTNAKPAIERSQAAMNLSPGNTGNSELAFNALKARVSKDPFWAVRMHALGTLLSWSDSSHNLMDILIDRAKHDPRPEIRSQAVTALAQHHYEKETTERALVAIFEQDSSYSVVGSVLNALVKYDPDRAYQLSLMYLHVNSPRDRMRHDAIEVLGHTKTHASLEKLMGLVDIHNMPKMTRSFIIEQISKFVSVDSAMVYRGLWNLTNNGDNGVRGSAINRLAEIGNEATLHQLEAQEATRPDMKGTYDAALKRMRKRLE